MSRGPVSLHLRQHISPSSPPHLHSLSTHISSLRSLPPGVCSPLGHHQWRTSYGSRVTIANHAENALDRRLPTCPSLTSLPPPQFELAKKVSPETEAFDSEIEEISRTISTITLKFASNFKDDLQSLFRECLIDPPNQLLVLLGRNRSAMYALFWKPC